MNALSRAARSMAPGFGDQVLDSQESFRSLMDAMARPGTIVALGKTLAPPAPLGQAAAAIILAMCDFETSLFLCPALEREQTVGAYLRFHTGARRASGPQDASFAVVNSRQMSLRLADFGQGILPYPDRSTTVLLEVPSLRDGPPLVVAGPGIPGTATLTIAGLPNDFTAQWQANRTGFPLGVDLVAVCGHEAVALPRSLTVIGERV